MVMEKELFSVLQMATITETGMLGTENQHSE